LLSALRSPDSVARATAARSCGALHMEKHAVGALLLDTEPPVRAAAADSLVEMRWLGEEPEARHAERFVELLEDPDAAVRAAALRGLVSYASESKDDEDRAR